MADVANKYELQAEYATYVGGSSIPYDPAQKFGSAHAGKALMHNGDDIVDLVTDAKEIIGKLVRVEPDGFVVVQDEGYMSLPTDTTTITYLATNDGLVGGATDGTVRTATTAETATAVRRAIAIKSDGTNKVIARL